MYFIDIILYGFNTNDFIIFSNNNFIININITKSFSKCYIKKVGKMKITTQKEKIEIYLLRKFGDAMKDYTVEASENNYKVTIVIGDTKCESILITDKYMKETSYIQQINQMYNDFKQVC